MVKINCCNNDDDDVVGNERRRFHGMTNSKLFAKLIRDVCVGVVLELGGKLR